MTVNHHRNLPQLEHARISHQRELLTHKRLKAILAIAVPAIAKPRSSRSRHEDTIIYLVLTLIRNAIYHTANVDISATIDAVDRNEVLHLVLMMASMPQEFQKPAILLMDILSHLMNGVDPTALFVERSDTDLGLLLDRERRSQRSLSTRHSRFGTLVGLRRADGRVRAISGQTALLTNEKAIAKLDESKIVTTRPPKLLNPDPTVILHVPMEIHLLANKKQALSVRSYVTLTSSAKKHMRDFVVNLLEAAIDRKATVRQPKRCKWLTTITALLLHIFNAIEREVPDIHALDHRRHTFFVLSWLLEASWVYCGSRWFRSDQIMSISLVNRKVCMALIRFMQESFDAKEWNILATGMRCLSQVLLAIEEMAHSRLEEDRILAEPLLELVVYEAANWDRVLSFVRNNYGKCFNYLDACTELSHVFVRMLQRLSGRRALLPHPSHAIRPLRKRTSRWIDADADNLTDEPWKPANELEIRTSRFLAKFVTQSTVDAFVSFTRHYNDLDPGQLKRAHRFFHLVAFKEDKALLLYRVDILALFCSMIKGSQGLDPEGESFAEWEKLIREVLKQLFKRLERQDELLVEMLFSKTSIFVSMLQSECRTPTVSESGMGIHNVPGANLKGENRLGDQTDVRPSRGRKRFKKEIL